VNINKVAKSHGFSFGPKKEKTKRARTEKARSGGQ
jgi:hypothetical protein